MTPTCQIINGLVHFKMTFCITVAPLAQNTGIIEVSSGVAPAEPVHIGGEALLIQFGRHGIVSTAVKWLLSKLKTRGLRLKYYLHII